MEKNKTGKYFKYALGEIVLVVIGIIIALQLNNWNEARKNEDQYRAVLQQMYTVIDQDAENLNRINYNILKQIEIIDSLVQHPESIDRKLLPHLLFYLDKMPSDLTSEISYLLGYLKFNPESRIQSNLNKMLSSYGNTINERFSGSQKNITPFLEELNLPYPSINFGYSVLNDYQNMDKHFFSDSEIRSAFKLLENPLFQNALKSLKSRKSLNSIFIRDLINLTITNKTSISKYYPSVKLLYSDIGLVGDGTKYNDWNKNVELTLTNDLEAIWEGDVILTNGFVKLREGENWNFNWGGDEFPIGTSQFYGNNIKVKSGNYHVIFNLSDKSYKFIRQVD